MKKIRLVSVVLGVVALFIGFGPYICKSACDFGYNNVSDTAKVVLTNVFLIVNILALFFVKNNRGTWLKIVSLMLSLVVVSFSAYTGAWMAEITANSIVKVVAVFMAVVAILLGVISYLVDRKASGTES